MSLVEFLNNYTYAMSFWGTAIIGLTAGALGVFPYLRKQSLIGDVISHAALPGTLLAFLAAVLVFDISGRNMVLLTVGAIIVGSLAAWTSQLISRYSIIKIDTAMAISLTVFFGFGMLLMQFIDSRPLPGKGGVQDYLFGNASTIIMADLQLALAIGGIAILIMGVFWKEFKLRTFDPEYSQVAGFSSPRIDALMFITLVLSIVIGVKSVGLVLMVAFVVTPPAAARQWTSSLSGMVLISALIGGGSSALGTYLSIVAGPIPTGPMIVLVMFGVLVFSLLCAPKRSIIYRAIQRARLQAKLRKQLSTEPASSLGCGD